MYTPSSAMGRGAKSGATALQSNCNPVEPLTLTFPYTHQSLESSVSLFAQLQISSSNNTPYADSRRHNWWQNLPKGVALTQVFPLQAACSGTTHLAPLCIACTPAFSSPEPFFFSLPPQRVAKFGGSESRTTYPILLPYGGGRRGDDWLHTQSLGLPG